MANIVIPNAFTASTLAKSADVNANFAEVASKFNSYAVQTDVAKTITAQHTWANHILFTDGLYDIGQLGANRLRSIYLTGNVSLAAGSILLTGAGGAARLTTTRRLTYSEAAVAYNLDGVVGADTYQTTITNGAAGYSAVETRYGGIVNVFGMAGATTAGAIVTPTLLASFTPAGLLVAGAQATSVTAGDVSLPNAKAIRGTNAAGTDTKPLIALNASNQVSIDSGGVGTVFGAAIVAPHMTSPVVDSGGMTITGNLNVSGQITGGAIGNVVAQPSDLTTTSTTPGNSSLTVALGANQTWRLDFALGVACASTGGILLNLTVPAGATGRLTYAGATNSATTVVDQTTSTITSALGFALYAGNGGVQMSLYIATTASTGSVTLQASAGTGGQLCTLYAGSTVLASRIS